MRFETGKDAKDVTMPDFRRLLEDAVKFHGHLCGGQSIGVRMAMAGLRELGIDNPRGEDGKDLVIFVETDRCATDAVISVTGRTPGKRSVKLVDYGKMAATFVHAGTGKAVRINVRPDAHEKALRIAQTCMAEVDEKTALLSALASIPEEELLRIQNVHVVLRPQDLPGKPRDCVGCEICGEMVWDMRAVHRNGKILCRPCAEMRAYYTVCTGPPRLGMSEANPEGKLSCEKDEMSLPEIDWNEC